MAKNINLAKVNKIAFLAFFNAIRLHEDSILLYRNNRFPTAYAISVLSMEEIGKFAALDHFSFHSTSDCRMSIKDENTFFKLLYNHKFKQDWFVREIYDIRAKRKIVKEITSGHSEISKQNSFYVGLPRKNKTIDLKGKISNPEKRISKEKAERQITLINDYLLCLALGVYKGVYWVDNQMLSEVLNNELIENLRKSWKKMASITKRDFDKLVKLPNSMDSKS